MGLPANLCADIVGQVYVGNAGSAMQVHSQSSITLNYTGPATLYPAPARATTSAATTVVQLSLQGQVNPGQKTAQVKLDVGSQRYHLIVRGNSGAPSLTPTLTAFEQATRQGNWATLYGLMMSDTVAGTTQAAFGAQMAQATSTLGIITAVRRGSVGQPEVTDLGFTIARATYAIDRNRPGAAAVTATYDVTFLLEGATWKVWYMDAR